MDEGMTVIGDLSRVLRQQGIRPLVEAGAAMATLADPDPDLLDIGSAFGNVAVALKEIAADLGEQYDRLSEISAFTPLADAKRDDGAREACTAAARKAKRSLVALVALIAELDNSLTRAEPGR